MFVKGPFWCVFVWLCVTHGPEAGSEKTAAADPVAAQSAQWRGEAGLSLGLLKQELDGAVANNAKLARKFKVGVTAGGAVEDRSPMSRSAR